ARIAAAGYALRANARQHEKPTTVRFSLVHRKSLADLVSTYQPKDPTRALKTPSFPTLNALAAKNWIDLP
ncbi:hypothetical protein, partial [Burkholderia contaminans]|uniref:hypothetical protein n=3 Tax=Burkholderia TaxID=32008 RepID=UPI001ABB6A77